MSARQLQDVLDKLSRIENSNISLERTMTRLENQLSVTNTIVPTLDTIEQLAKTIKYTIDYDLFPLIKQNRPQKMDIDKPIIQEVNIPFELNSMKDSLNTHLDQRLREFSNQLSLQLDLEPFRNNMVKIIVDVAKTHKLIEQGGKALLDLFAGISPTLQELAHNSYSLQQQMHQLLSKPTISLDPIVQKLQELDSNLHDKIFIALTEEIRKIPSYDYNSKLNILSQDINTLKFIQRDPIDQSETHNKLKEIIRLVSLLNVDDINLQLSKLNQPVVPTPVKDYTTQLRNIEQELKIRDPTIKLDLLSRDLKALLSKAPLTQASSNAFGSQTITTHVEHSTATYLIYSDEKSPDRSHFLL